MCVTKGQLMGEAHGAISIRMFDGDKTTGLCVGNGTCKATGPSSMGMLR